MKKFSEVILDALIYLACAGFLAYLMTGACVP